MGRGKIEIKRIENQTNRQVTYSKRRAGIMKKAKELTVLCDAEVSLIMFSSSGKCVDFISPTISQKEFYDKYQKITRDDLWKSQYDKMQEELKTLVEINRKLRREIGQRVGEDLDDLSIQELRSLEQDLRNTEKVVRQRKFGLLSSQGETQKKKVRNLAEINSNLWQEYQERSEEEYALANGMSALELGNGVAPHIYSFRLHPSQPNLHEDEEYEIHGLRLA
uniref:MADS transcription factor AP3-1 n=2 Tax=Trautvetteria caroliniensis TaxID=46993 RepID=A0A7L7T1V1_9MAGN|nr:MADS transcription factor AP3-1 [Trautvetteria caroliniensis]